MRFAVQAVDGPSVLDADDLTILRGAATAADPAEPGAVERWDAIRNHIGLPPPAAPVPEPHELLLAVWALESVAADIGARRPRPPRLLSATGSAVEGIVSGLPHGTARPAMDIAAAIAAAAARPQAASREELPGRMAQLRRSARIGPSEDESPIASALSRSLTAAGVPWIWSRLRPGLLVAGEGRNRILFDGATALSTPLGAAMISRHRMEGAAFLEQLGVPVPRRLAATGIEAIAAAADALGYPVLVRTMRGTVLAEPASESALRDAGASAPWRSGPAVVEAVRGAGFFVAALVDGVIRDLRRREATGTTETIDAAVHPEMAAIFRRLARLTGLIFAVVEFRTDDVRRPLRGQPFAIVDIQMWPVAVDPVVTDAVAAVHFPPGRPRRLPTAIVIDPRADDDAAELAAAARAAGAGIGFAGPSGLDLGGIAGLRDTRSPRAAQLRMIEDPAAALALHWRRPADFARHGLGIAALDHAFVPAGGAAPRLEALVQRHARRVAPLPEGGPAERMAAVLAAIGHRR